MFKIGDWVICRDYGGNEEFRNYEDELNDIFKSIKLWSPKEGEWCWFGTSLVRIESISEYPTTYTLYTKTSDGQEHRMVETDCKLEPFIGEFPSFIKDK